MIYVASPYSGTEREMEERYDDVVHFVAHIVNEHQNLVLYSPIAHWHPIANTYDLPKDHEFWLAQDREMITLSTGVWVLKLPGWQQSKGVSSEIAFCANLGKPVDFFDGIDQCLEAIRSGTVLVA